jgi:2-keto-myo-inositol isomerase
MPTLHRRHLLAGAASTAATLVATRSSSAAALDDRPEQPFRYCLNTSTIRGQKLKIEEEIDIAAKAGYDGIEPWLNKLSTFQQAGGKLSDLRKRIDDAGLRVEGAIGFANWISDDESARQKGLENARRDMDIVAQIGGNRIAAPPAGATRQAGLDLFQAAERFGRLVDLGAEMSVAPQLELWGFSKNLSRVGELLLVAAECGRPDVGLLPDVYHIYKGGSDFASLSMIRGKSMNLFHMNDYPLDPPRETIRDAERVYPGDGKAPIQQILQTIHGSGFRGTLSLELFNPNYWNQDPLLVAKTGLAKMKAVVAAAKLTA